MRYIATILLLITLSLCIYSASADQASANGKEYNYATYEKDPKKHAVIVIDADDHKILYKENAFKKRYPASLTKMMTLYMTFDAMRKGKIKPNTRMRVSKLAAKQPQTNIQLKKGQRITVDTAIRALVVRSANDAAIVLAEKLGGNVKRFAYMMNKKAKSLGMRNTFFVNPSGLPDKRQVTTAYDMAILGAALRRDFPQYYPYFTLKEFKYRGKTYKTHNHVLKEYAGVDGIKTGYIRDAGFNLVSSIQKDGFNIIAVVLGGKTSKMRDEYMKDVLDKTFAGLRHIYNKPRLMARAPVPVMNPHRKAKEAPKRHKPTIKIVSNLSDKNDTKKSSSHTKHIAATNNKRKAPSASFKISLADDKATSSKHIKVTKRNTPKVSIKVIPVSSEYNSGGNSSSSKNNIKVTKTSYPPKNTLDYQLMQLRKKHSNKTTTNNKHSWGIQVGAFADEKSAKEAISKAFNIVNKTVRYAYIDIEKSPSKNSNHAIHRARIANLSKEQAFNACQQLQSISQNCFALKVN